MHIIIKVVVVKLSDRKLGVYIIDFINMTLDSTNNESI